MRPCHGVIQDPVLPRHLDPAHNGVGSGVGGIVCVKNSINPMTVKSVDADSRQALPGVYSFWRLVVVSVCLIDLSEMVLG